MKMNQATQKTNEVLSIKEKFTHNLGAAISSGVFAAIWFFLAGLLEIEPYAGFFGWSVYFFAGANVEAAKKTLPSVIVGPLLAYLTIYGTVVFESSFMMIAIIAFLLGFIMTILQVFSFFEIAGATFIGANVYFASMSLYQSIFGMMLGLVLGMASVKLSGILNDFIIKGE